MCDHRTRHFTTGRKPHKVLTSLLAHYLFCMLIKIPLNHFIYCIFGQYKSNSLRRHHTPNKSPHFLKYHFAENI
ncbi:hypothetical protein Y032_0333g2804 [Ancylostoma ceylanicum]|uniref:Uncharacterized protein n=1 Tax=Ancylostoma ceylanicum TaxID=53326 RepID=A0A016RZ76_9BILA|nr:hypothetical protein Y032_0333g2804 [Ancylostoma ceylanicum]